MLSIARASTSSDKPGIFHYAVVSDIHFGHQHTPAAFIAHNWKTSFFDDPVNKSLDMLFLAGDVFDNALWLYDDDVYVIDGWMDDLLRFCKDNNIVIVILEGTPGHDRKQPKRFVTINKNNRIDADLHYVSDVSIKYFAQFNLHVLFVPDEPPGGPVKTLQTVKDLMRVKGLQKIDIGIMHGLFDFQLPEVSSSAKHVASEYLSLVENHISIGHDHTYKRHERIHVQGSFDRIGHGYETPKGYMRFLLDMVGDWEISFVENTGAMDFVTVDCKDMPLDESLICIKERVQSVRDEGSVRIVAQSDHPIFTNMEELVRHRPLIRWTKTPKKDKNQEIAPMTQIDEKYIPITITRDNLPELLLERMASNGASGAVMEQAQHILMELLACRRTTIAQAVSTSA